MAPRPKRERRALRVVGEPDPPKEVLPAEPPAALAAPTAEDERKALFQRHLVAARAHNKNLEDALEVVRGIRKKRTVARNLCSMDGFPLRDLDDILIDEVRPMHELEDAAEVRTFMRSEARLPVLGAQQLSLFGATEVAPQPTKDDEAYWDSDGYRHGLRGDDASPQNYGVPQDMFQAWLTGWGNGQGALGQRMVLAQTIESRRGRDAEGILDDKDDGEGGQTENDGQTDIEDVTGAETETEAETEQSEPPEGDAGEDVVEPGEGATDEEWDAANPGTQSDAGE